MKHVGGGPNVPPPTNAIDRATNAEPYGPAWALYLIPAARCAVGETAAAPSAHPAPRAGEQSGQPRPPPTPPTRHLPRPQSDRSLPSAQLSAWLVAGSQPPCRADGRPAPLLKEGSMGSRIRTSGTSRARVLLIGLCQLLLLSSARASTSPPHQWWLDQTYLTGAAPSFTVDQTGVIHATTYSTLPSPRNTYWRRDDNCHWGAFAFSPGNDPRPQGFNTSVAMGTDGQPYIAYVGHTTMSVNSSLQARIAHYAGTLTNPWTHYRSTRRRNTR